jgi:hypothetical protein
MGSVVLEHLQSKALSGDTDLAQGIRFFSGCITALELVFMVWIAFGILPMLKRFYEVKTLKFTLGTMVSLLVWVPVMSVIGDNTEVKTATASQETVMESPPSDAIPQSNQVHFEQPGRLWRISWPDNGHWKNDSIAALTQWVDLYLGYFQKNRVVQPCIEIDEQRADSLGIKEFMDLVVIELKDWIIVNTTIDEASESAVRTRTILYENTVVYLVEKVILKNDKAIIMKMLFPKDHEQAFPGLSEEMNLIMNSFALR